jgi:hypothetical protein
MALRKLVGTGAIAGALAFSAIGLAGVANAAPPAPAAPAVSSIRSWPTGADPAGTAPVARLGWTRLGLDPAGAVRAGAACRCLRRVFPDAASESRPIARGSSPKTVALPNGSARRLSATQAEP